MTREEFERKELARINAVVMVIAKTILTVIVTLA